jgi:peptide/nickel transport system substrate-binding protein
VKHRSRERQIAFAAAILTIAMSAGCGKSSDRHAAGRHPWTIPGILRIAMTQEPTNLNPPIAANWFDVSMFVYSWAVRYDARARPVPDALRDIPTVANGDVSKDGLTLKYRLRRNIAWQDGVPLTCRDLMFTWRVVMNPHNNVTVTDGYRDIESIDCSNPYVAVIHMKRVYAPYLQQLWGVNGNAPILPEHLLAKYNDDKGSFNTAPYNSLPVGSGPFKVVRWERGQEIRLVANPDFYLGRPKLKEVIFKVIPDANTAEQALQTHSVDILSDSPIRWPADAPVVNQQSNGIVMKVADTFNFSKVDFNLQRPIVSDRNVRVALAYATDRAGIVKKLLHGFGIVAETDQHPRFSWAYTSAVTHYAYDPQKARRILEADGWKVGPDGVRVRRGQRLAFEFTGLGGVGHPTQGQLMMQREWREIGVDAEIKNYPTAELLDPSPSGIIQCGRYDAADLGYVDAADPDDSEFYSSRNLAPRGQNITRWINPVASAAIDDALRSVDQARRRRDYIVVQQQLTHDLPTIVLAYGRLPYIYNSDLKGFDPSPVVSAYWNPWSYSI